MNLNEIRMLAVKWVEVRGKYSEAYERLDELVRLEPSIAFRVIEEIHFRLTTDDPDYELMGLLAAGPLEDLLSEHGQLVIDNIEALAKQDPEFRKCLAGVWQNAMEDDLHARVQKAADPTWRFA